MSKEEPNKLIKKSNEYAVNNHFCIENSDGDYNDTYDDIKEAFIDGATWMKEQMINEIWEFTFENISEISEELMLEKTSSIEIANKIKESLEKLF